MVKKQALLIVDMQKDFCPDGNLPVSQGDTIISVINQYISFFNEKNQAIFASRDWHPAETKHFKKFGGKWPVHCVQDTPGAEFHPNLKLPEDTIILSKGMNSDQDSYSAFQAGDDEGNQLMDLIKDLSIEFLFVCGLATDYCVKESVMDALDNGLNVYLLADAIKGVNLSPQDSTRSVREMMNKGVHTMVIADLPR